MRVFGYLRNFLSKGSPSADDAAQLVQEVELAKRSIEDRLEHVADKLQRGRYNQLESHELEALIEDIDYIIEFVDYATKVLTLATHVQSLNASRQRLLYVRTRAQNITRARQQNVAGTAS